MRLVTAKRKYRNEWIAFHFSNLRTEEGEVLFHDRDRHRFHKRLVSRRLPSRDVYVTYTGRLIPDPKEYAVVLFLSR